MSEVNNNLFKDFALKAPNTSSDAASCAPAGENRLERSPAQDSLEKSKENNSQKNKDKIIKYGLGALSVVVGVAAFACGKRSVNQKTAQQAAQNAAALEKQAQKLSENQRTIEAQSELITRLENSLAEAAQAAQAANKKGDASAMSAQSAKIRELEAQLVEARKLSAKNQPDAAQTERIKELEESLADAIKQAQENARQAANAASVQSKRIKELEAELETARKQISSAQPAQSQSAKIKELEQKLEEATKALNEAKANQTKASQGEIKAITEALEEASTKDGAAGAQKEKFIRQYSDLIQNPKLEYDPLAAPTKKIVPETYWVRNTVKISDVKPFDAVFGPQLLSLDTKALQQKLHAEGRLDITLPSIHKIEAVSSPDAFIDGKQIANLGEIVDSEITTAYGKRINWSNEKIARDIMQNFYDGHGNTLDGVRIFLEKRPNGTIKVKITGQGFYEYTNLQLLGSGNKSENLFNAGGFGEGSKVLVANLLGKGDTSRVTYSCADWKLSFCSPKDGSVIQRKLERTPEVLRGNSIEFETKNQELVDSIIESINYFRHSKNPDFQNLTFDSRDFGFRFLGEKSGNIYLTQRFEFEGSGKWHGAVDGLDLIFKRKPDPVEYKKITGVELPKDRDRTSLTFEDIKNLTRYFAHSMSDDELLSSIVSTKPMWGKIDYSESGQSALKSFLEGLISETNSRGLRLDIGNEKYAAATGYMNGVVVDSLNSYGYEILPKFFGDLGWLTANQVFEKLSVHTPLQPTQVEVKKMKLLEEGLELISKDITEAFTAQLKKADIKINPSSDKEFRESPCLRALLYMEYNSGNSVVIDILKKYSQPSFIDYIDISEALTLKISEEDMKVLCGELTKGVNKRLHEMVSKPDIPMLYEIISNVSSCNKFSNCVDVKTLDYLTTLKDYTLILPEDVKKPRYIFDRHSEIASNTLGESIVSHPRYGRFGIYKGHWVDREYLDTADFMQILGTWIHEVCHKSGGDGDANFTYALTDMLRVLLRAGVSGESSAKLAAIEEVYNKL